MIFQNEKTLFQAIKTRSSKSQKIDIFPKGLKHGFGPTMDNFQTFFFKAIEARKLSFTIFQNEKRPFQAITTKSSKRRKIDIFPKGLTHGFSPKKAIFRTFLLGKKGQKNIIYDIVEKKNTFLGYKNKKFKNSKTSQFSKGVFLPKMAIFPTFLFRQYRPEKYPLRYSRTQKRLSRL